MKKILFIGLLLIGLNSFSQENDSWILGLMHVIMSNNFEKNNTILTDELKLSFAKSYDGNTALYTTISQEEFWTLIYEDANFDSMNGISIKSYGDHLSYNRILNSCKQNNLNYFYQNGYTIYTDNYLVYGFSILPQDDKIYYTVTIMLSDL